MAQDPEPFSHSQFSKLPEEVLRSRTVAVNISDQGDEEQTGHDRINEARGSSGSGRSTVGTLVGNYSGLDMPNVVREVGETGLLRGV